MVESSRRPDAAEVDRLVKQAESLAATGNHLEARETILRALDLSADAAALHARAAYYTFHAGRAGLPEAPRLVEHHLAVSRELGPTLPFHHHWAGRIAAAQGNVARARLMFQAALTADATFDLAREALVQLDGASPREPERVQFSPARSRTPRKTQTTMLAVVAIAAALVAGGYHFMPDRAMARLAEQLGTEFSILSASERPPELMIEIGESWDELPPATRDAVLVPVADRARQLGYDTLVIYSKGHRVWERMTGLDCPGQACVLRQQEQPAVTGGVTVTVEMTPMP